MKTKMIVLALLLYGGCLYCPGCQMFEPDDAGPTIDIIFGETVSLLTDARVAGDISDVDWAQIKAIAVDCNEVLDAWYESQANGQSGARFESQVRGYIRVLRGYLKEEENGQ